MATTDPMGFLPEPGEPESSGRFSIDLEAARRQLKLLNDQPYGVGPVRHLGKLVQMCVRLGAETVVFPSQASREWTVVAGGLRGSLNPRGLRADLATMALGPGQPAEKLLATALLGMEAERAFVTQWEGDAPQVEVALLGPPGHWRHLPARPGRWLQLSLGFERECHLQRYPWHDACLAPLTIACDDPKGPEEPLSSSYQHWLSPLNPEGQYWLEWLLVNPDGSLQLRSLGRPDLDLGPSPRLAERAAPTRLRHYCRLDGETPDRPRGSQVVLVRERLVHPSKFHPVQAGLLLGSLSCPELPPGFDIVFEADGLSTDLSLNRLVDGPALRQRLAEAIARMPQVVDDLMAHAQRLTVPSVPREWSQAPGRFGLSLLAVGGLALVTQTWAGLVGGGALSSLATYLFGCDYRRHRQQNRALGPDLGKHLQELKARWESLKAANLKLDQWCLGA